MNVACLNNWTNTMQTGKKRELEYHIFTWLQTDYYRKKRQHLCLVHQTNYNRIDTEASYPFISGFRQPLN